MNENKKIQEAYISGRKDGLKSALGVISLLIDEFDESPTTLNIKKYIQQEGDVVQDDGN